MDICYPDPVLTLLGFPWDPKKDFKLQQKADLCEQDCG